MSGLTYVKQFAYTLLLIASIGLVYWQHYGMNTSLEIPLSSSSRVKAFNDDINGGRSVGRLSFTDDRPAMECQIIRSDTFAFCGLKILLGDGDDGVDLSGMDRLVLDLEYHSRFHDTLLVYLNNREGYYNREIIRANQLTLVPDSGRRTYSMNINDLHVPSWWVFQQSSGTPLRPRIDNVSELQISTGDNTQPRDVQFSVHSVTLTGKWISSQQLLTGLALFWSVVAVVQIFLLAIELNKKYKVSRSRAEDLNHINQFLKIERDRMESMAKNDALTGCLNRNGLSDILTSIIQSHKQSSDQTSLILLDIDHFKRVNDQFGHSEGDRVLKNLANLIHEHVRDSDYLVRWGGEEFALICTNTTLEGSQYLAENLCKRIAAATLTEKTAITASFGVAQLKVPNVELWFKAADKALYQAKANGRNGVVVSDD